MIIDTHLHIWDRERSTYAWLEAADPALSGSFSVADAFADLGGHGVSGAILVQADETAAETDFLLEKAAEDPRILGVVGYAPLHDPETLVRELDRLLPKSALCGVRNLTHDREDPDWIVGDRVLEGIAIVAERGLPLDFVSVLPRHLVHVPTIARRHPELTLVLDHLGKPPIGGSAEQLRSWRDRIGDAAAAPNVVAKLSGLYPSPQASGPTTPDLHDLVHEAVETWGSDRLMFGSDWPLCRTAGGADAVLSSLLAAIEALPAEARDDILFRTARRVYPGGAR